MGNQAAGRAALGATSQLAGVVVQRNGDDFDPNRSASTSKKSPETAAREAAEKRATQPHDADEIKVYKAFVNGGFGPSRFRWWEDLSNAERAKMGLGASTPDYVLDGRPADAFVVEPPQQASEALKLEKAFDSIAGNHHKKSNKYGSNTIVIINVNRIPTISAAAVGHAIHEKYPGATATTYMVKSGRAVLVTIGANLGDPTVAAVAASRADRAAAAAAGDSSDSDDDIGFSLFDGDGTS